MAAAPLPRSGVDRLARIVLGGTALPVLGPVVVLGAFAPACWERSPMEPSPTGSTASAPADGAGKAPLALPSVSPSAAAAAKPEASGKLDPTEVTVAAYEKCVTAGRCSDAGLAGRGIDLGHLCNWRHRAKKAAHPINCVTIAQARAHCRWRGARLPRATEWLAMAGDRERRRYPWGSKPWPASWSRTADFQVVARKHACWCGVGTCEVGGAYLVRHPLGLSDIAGNVAEWVEEDRPLHRRGAYAQTPIGLEETWTVAMGTAWSDPSPHDIFELTTHRERAFHELDVRKAYVGFRCVAGAKTRATQAGGVAAPRPTSSAAGGEQ